MHFKFKKSRQLFFMKTIILSVIALFSTAVLLAQQPAAKTHKYANMPQQKIGVITGTIVDSVTRHPIPSASVFVFSERHDTATHLVKEMLVGSIVSQSDGSFEINNIPVPGRFKLSVSVVGRETYEKMVSLTPANSSLEVGKVLMQQTSTNLQTVTVTAAANNFMSVGVDKKVFSVANSIVSTGQTAQEVMAQIPSVNVDIDGNVTLRGATPQIYVDGMPTTLSLDQIPSDLIDRVEVITNPSAKYDASDANGGIINIILKKNNTRGYNGGISAGTDTRNQYNFAGDLNVRLGKWNLFGNAAYRRRNSLEHDTTNRYNLLTNQDGTVDTTNHMLQRSKSISPGHFVFVNIGATYNFDKRNLATLQGRIVNGAFNSNQPQYIDSTFYNGEPSVYSILNSTTNMRFNNVQGDLRYQHNFSDDGNHNLIFDINYNHVSMHQNMPQETNSYLNPDYTGQYGNTITDSIHGNGGVKNLVFQGDYVNPITKNSKIEAGIRGQITSTNTLSTQYADSTGSGDMLISQGGSSKYNFHSQTYAAYVMFSSKLWDKLAYQLGLRVEDYIYKGTEDSIAIPAGIWYQYPNGAGTFKKHYLNPFPSVDVTYNLTDAQSLQFSYARKVQRPSFFQLLPNINYSNPYNLSRGNPDLNPQFTSMYELSYDNNYGHNNSFVGGIYYRHSSNLITGIQYQDAQAGPNTIMNTYINASASETYGLELIDKTTFFKIWDLIGNVNIYNTGIDGMDSLSIDGNHVDSIYTNRRWSWFGKITSNLRLPLGITLQITGQYFSKTILPSSGGNSSPTSTSGGGRYGGGAPGTSQGYIGSRSEVDAAVSKLWRFKAGNTLSLIVSINDIFGGSRNFSYSPTQFMDQTSVRLRQPRIVRFTLSYRFGKMDMKKKQQPQTDDNSDDMSGGIGGGM